ncbi:MAG: glycosyltransferase family 4 protein [Armatimonadetes bacterium]|nr:glycosyltransferase family 4 protein [Armatimonadota bacterium]
MIRELAARGFAQHLVAGVPCDAELPALEGLPPGAFSPVVFGTGRLPFPVVGMSDVMPYRSTRWGELDRVMLESYVAAFAEVLGPVIEGFQPEVIHSHHLWLMTALVRVLYPHHRLVASCHSTDLRQLRAQPQFAPYLLPALKCLDGVYALTDEQQNGIEAQLGLPRHRIHVVGAGYRSDIFAPGADQRVSNRVAYAGKLSRAKGLPWLLQAAAPLLSDGRMELELAGSGSGQEAEEIEAAARRPGVRLLGRLEQPELAARLRQSAVFVLPSFYEGLPLVLIEALACGCRVVSTRLPGVESWLSPDLFQSGWVELVDLPPLEGVDEPAPAELPAFMGRLQSALERVLRPGERDPAPLERALRANSWGSVVDRIQAQY